MSKILFLFLSLLKTFRKVVLKIQGKKESDIHAERIVTGKAWEEFCDQLKLAGSTLMYPGAPRDVFQQAEGIRYLTRLTRAALEAYVEYGDTSYPELRRMAHETVKLGADNPDNYYMNAQISGAYEYRIVGKRNTVDYIGFFTQNGVYGQPGGMATCGILENHELVIEPDGSFEIIVSKEKKGKNWLKIEDSSSMIIVRQTFFDRAKEKPAEVRIENLNGQKAPQALTAEKIDKGLATAALFVAGAPLLFARWAEGFKKHTNQLPIFDAKISNASGGDPRIIYHHSYWKLEDDEALLIKFIPPDCESWNFQLNNYWMESLDYRYYPICINKNSAVPGKDGSVEIVVSKINPGAANWIDTCMHNEGTMCLRWYRLKKNENTAIPQCDVVKLNTLIKK